MSDSLNTYLQQALNRLAKMDEKITAGDVGEASKELQQIRMLVDLIKEQMPNEDTHSTARQTR